VSNKLSSKANAVNSEILISCGNVCLRPDDIICIELNEDYTLELHDLADINSAIAQLASGRKHFVITVGGKYTAFSQDVLKNSNNPSNFTYTIADAFVIKSTHQRLLANFYIRIIKPPVPTRYFENLDMAVAWLQTRVKH